jgi:hypothetical protein
VRKGKNKSELLHIIEEVGVCHAVHAPDPNVLSWWRGLATAQDPLHIKKGVNGYCEDVETASSILDIHKQHQQQPGMYARCEIRVSFLWKIGFTMKIMADSRRQWIGKWCRLIRPCETLDPNTEYEVEMEGGKEILIVLGQNIKSKKRTQGFYAESKDGRSVARVDFEFENDGRVLRVTYKPKTSEHDDEEKYAKEILALPPVTIKPPEQGLIALKNYYRLIDTHMTPGAKYGNAIFPANAMPDGTTDVVDLDAKATLESMEMRNVTSCLYEDANFEVVWRAVQCPGEQRVAVPTLLKDHEGEWLGLQSGTVTSREGTNFRVRLDHENVFREIDVMSSVLLPCTTYVYGPGTRVYLRFKQEWHFDCTVEKCVDPSCNLHEITLGKGGDVVQQKLNEANHVPAYLSQAEYTQKHQKYCQGIMAEYETVEDAITKNRLKTADQLVQLNLELRERDGEEELSDTLSDTDKHALAEIKNVDDVAQYMLVATKTSAFARRASLCDVLWAKYLSPFGWRPTDQPQHRPVLIKSGAGTGKTWLVSQLMWTMGNKMEKGFPFMLSVQHIATALRHERTQHFQYLSLNWLINLKVATLPLDEQAAMVALLSQVSGLLIDSIDSLDSTDSRCTR